MAESIALNLSGRGDYTFLAVVNPPAWQGMAVDSEDSYVWIGGEPGPVQKQRSFKQTPAVAVADLATLESVRILIRCSLPAGSPATTARAFVYSPGGVLGYGADLILPAGGGIKTKDVTISTNLSLGRGWYASDLSTLQVGVELDVASGGDPGSEYGRSHYLESSAMITRKVGKITIDEGSRIAVRSRARVLVGGVL